MLHVIATIELKPGLRDTFLSEFRQVVPAVRQEAGCLEYGPTIDLETNIAAQPAPRHDVVTVVEKWESLEALEAHLIAPHMIEYRARVKDLLQSVTIHVLKPLSA